MAARNVTITEALATIKLVPKRINAKLQAARGYLIRERSTTDPLEKEGGSEAFVAATRQSVGDLIEDLVKMRTAVLGKSLSTELTIMIGERTTTRTVQGWIIWRREAVPLLKELQGLLAIACQSAEQNAIKLKARVVEDLGVGEGRHDILVTFHQTGFHKEVEELEMVLAKLDAELSRINATTTLSVPDGPFVI